MRQICVLDTDSILIGVSLELGGTKIIDWLSKIFDIYIPFFVIKHELKGASKDYKLDIQEIRRKLHDIKVKVIVNEYFDSCLKVIRKWLNKSNLDIDEGERSCLALSLYLSRNQKNFIFLITDDFRARDEALDKFVYGQKIGVTLSSPDMILYAFARNRDVSSAQTLCSLQNFFARMQVKKRASEKKRKYMESYVQMCRKAGLAFHLCQQQCFSTQGINEMLNY